MQWSLEQQQFVLCGATYTWSFFSDTHHGTNIPRLAESSDAEPQIWRADCKVICRFSSARGLVPNPSVVQGPSPL